MEEGRSSFMLQCFEIDPKWRSLGDCLLSNSTVQVLPNRINNVLQADRKRFICLV